MSFGENLQTIRKKNHLSQEGLAEMLGVSRQAVSKWELGEGYPEVDKLLLLSKKLNVSSAMPCMALFSAAVSPRTSALRKSRLKPATPLPLNQAVISFSIMKRTSALVRASSLASPSFSGSTLR